MNKKLSDLGPNELDKMTDTMTDAEISAMFELSRTAATHARNRFGIKSHAEKTGQRRYRESYAIKPGAKRAFSYRKSGANERYFQRIDTPRRAYWLGLLLADGWIVTHHAELQGFAIALHERDRDTLAAFAEDLGCADMIKPTRAGSALLQVKLTSSQAAQDLVSHGIVPKKSKVARLPQLSRGLMPHLVRGYFDGDGCVYVRGNSLSAQFTSGCLLLLEDLQAHLRFETGSICSLAPDRNSYCARLYAEGAVRLAHYMYGTMSADDVCFARKRQKFMDYLDSGAGRSWEQLPSVLDSAPSR